jgi:hypothetical protein
MTMEEGWTKIYTTDQAYQADIIIELLNENDIDGVIMNKRDSSYVAFGNIEVFVSGENKDKALEIIKQSEL